uniref:Uncharacterized protein n=1 Tax=Dromaius novaehollandiae TaxID=8790 RepID=A0A8C4KA98_DRONO
MKEEASHPVFSLSFFFPLSFCLFFTWNWSGVHVFISGDTGGVCPIEAIFSAADMGFKGSLLTSPAAYMGTITGCFLLTIFLVSIPKEHKSFLLLWEPPHWYLSPYASWISCSSVHTSIMASYPLFAKVSSVVICFSPASNKRFKELISSSISRTGIEGKQTSNIRSRRLNNVVYIK